MTSFGPAQYNFYQTMASEYRQRQENLRSHGKYVMTIKNHRQFMKNQSKTVKEQIAHFLDIDLTQHPDVLQDARAHTNEKNLRDFTVIFLFTLNDKELAQRVMKQRSEKFKQIGSFNVQLAQEDKLFVNKKLKPLKAAGVIAGYGQNQLGIMYIALKKLENEIEDISVYPSGTCSDKRFILLNAPSLDCELKDAENFRQLAKPVESIYVAKNTVSGKYLVLNKPENIMVEKRLTNFAARIWNPTSSVLNEKRLGVSKKITCEISNFDEYPRQRVGPLERPLQRGRIHTTGDFRGSETEYYRGRNATSNYQAGYQQVYFEPVRAQNHGFQNQKYHRLDFDGQNFQYPNYQSPKLQNPPPGFGAVPVCSGPSYVTENWSESYSKKPCSVGTSGVESSSSGRSKTSSGGSNELELVFQKQKRLDNMFYGFKNGINGNDDENALTELDTVFSQVQLSDSQPQPLRLQQGIMTTESNNNFPIKRNSTWSDH